MAQIVCKISMEDMDGNMVENEFTTERDVDGYPLMEKYCLTLTEAFQEQLNRHLKLIGEDDIDPYIRSQIGNYPNERVKLYIKTLDAGAVSEKTSLGYIGSDEERNSIHYCVEMKHMALTNDDRYYLTELGQTIAKGAKKVYKNSI